MKNIQNNNGKTKKKKTSSDPWARSGERPGRGHGSELFVFLFFPWFFAVWPKPQEHKKKQKKNKKFRPMGKVWAIHTQTKKTKKQETKKKKKKKKKKQKKNKKTRPNTLHLTPSPWGVQSCFFCFFGFLVSWFFGFLVCVWIAQTLPMGLNFLFFLVFFVFLRFWPNCKKPWKNQKTKTQETKKPKK